MNFQVAIPFVPMELPGFQYSEVKINLEVQFIRFYYDIFLKEAYYCSRPLTTDILKIVKNAYSTENIKNGTTDISFMLPEIRSSYIYQYAPCFASTVAYHYQKLLKGNPRLFEKTILQDTVNICCLGGGPATEFVAVAKVLEEMMWAYCPRAGRPMKIDATIIDVDSGWEQTTRKILETIPNLINMNLIQFNLTFIQADLTAPLSEDVLDVLKKADIVTMVKFLSSVRGENCKNLISQMLQKIIECIRESSVLFFLDSSGFQHYDELRNAIMSGRMIQFYGLIDYHIYRMSYPSLLECCRLYWGYFGMRYSAQQSKNYISAWYKW